MHVLDKVSLIKAKSAVGEKHTMSSFKLIMTIIGIACVVFFRFIPPYESITSIGFAVLGDFVGCVVLWTFVDLVWPFFLIVVAFGYDALAIYPNSTMGNGIYEAGAQSLGYWIPVFVIGCLIFCVLLEDAGIMKRITYFFITRKFAQRGGWSFSITLLGAALLLDLFLDITPVQLFFFGVAEEMFIAFGFKKGDDWPKFIITSMSYVLIIGFVMTPICHTLSILWMSVYSSITGQPSDILAYTMLAFPFGIILIALMLLWFRFVVKPDMSHFKDVDFSVLESHNPGPWTRKEKIVTVILLLTIASWLLPGVLNLVAPTCALNTAMNTLTQTGPLFIAIVALSIIHVDGKPILVLNDVFPRVQWGTIFLLAGFCLLANAFSSDVCGIGEYLSSVFTPYVQDLGPWAFVSAIGIICIILTSFMNQVPVGVIFMSVAIPLCMANGINPLIMAVTICIGSSMAFTIPPACLTIGIAFGNPWTKGRYICANGFVLMFISIIVTCLVCYPLGSLLFGA